ncbi:MAG: NAD-dependent epimerase/dehydratase family protein, partial [Acidimicrobiales bacterium]
MDIAISGSHGLIGSALVTSLEADGHLVRPIVRGSAGPKPERAVPYDAEGSTLDRGALEGVDAIVNLAGAPIAAGPFTHKHKRE